MSTNSEVHPLIKLYTAANVETWANPSIDAALAAAPKHLSKSLVAYQNGKKMDFEAFVGGMKGLKTQFPVIDIRYKVLTVGGPAEGEKGPRTLGSAECVWIPSAKMWFDLVVNVTYGEVGTEDENKVVELHETMNPVGTARDPDAAEWKSIL